jgi:hypothetical protein
MINPGEMLVVTEVTTGKSYSIFIIDVSGGFVEYQEFGLPSDVISIDSFYQKFIW